MKRLLVKLVLLFMSMNVYSLAIALDLKNSLHIDQNGSRYFVKLTFDEIPTQSEFDEIQLNRIQFLDYVPKNSYYCSIDESAHSFSFQDYGVIAIDTIPIEDKIDYALKHGIPEWMDVDEEGAVKLNIDYFKGLKDFVKLEEDLRSLGADILEHQEYFNRFYIRISYGELFKLGSLPWVQYVDTDNKPVTTDNYQAGQSHAANALRLENALGGRGLTGEGVKIGIFDDGEIGEHIDLDDRVTQVYKGNYGHHATHCLGTIGGAGKVNINALGMAPNVELYSWYMGSLTGMQEGSQKYGIMITSNSYGYLAQSICGERGKYDNYSSKVDKLTSDSTYFLHVFSAGNNATSCSNGWNTIGDGYNSSKNIITVGAIDKSNSIASFSSRGPLVDGRLKPEITSVGKNVYSTLTDNSYKSYQGTSMATPGVTGTVALLYERFMQLNNDALPDAALIKAAVCNTADDLGNEGPDYIYGYGKINGLRAVRVIEKANYFSNSISQSTVQTKNITIPANTGQLKVTLCWTDREAVANANPAIVNNLDLKVMINGINYSPWVLDPGSPKDEAVRGTDSLNVVELVTVDNPNQGNCILTVSGSSVPFGPQKYYIVYEFVKKGIELTYPLAADKITVNKEEYLRWNSFGLTDSVSIDLSTDNGVNWTALSKVDSKQKCYRWIPASSSSSGQTKIRLRSGSDSFTPDSTFSIFPQPDNFALATGDDESINMQWDSVANATAYEVLKLDDDYDWEIIDTTQNTTYNIDGLVDFNSYWLTVKAIGDIGAISQRVPAKSCQVITAYHTPQLHLPSNGGWSVDISPIFYWIKLRDTVSYQIQISTDEQFSQLITNNVTGDSLFSSDSLEYFTKYFWRVRALKQNDTTEWSEIRQFTTKEDPAFVNVENSSGNTLWAWGKNISAELGFYEYAKPTLVNNKKWKAIKTRYSNTWGIDSDGYLYAAGYGGRTGNGGSNTLYELTKIDSNKWVKITYSHAIREDGTLWGWGFNGNGQIGDGTSTDRKGLVQIGNETDWKDVSQGSSHTLAIKSDSSLWAWGDNRWGQLGDSTTTGKSSPIQIGNSNDWVAIGTGLWYSLALKSNGTLWAWGNNSRARLGDSTTTDRHIPIQIGNDTNWVKISAGERTSHAIKKDSSLWGWGYNDYGQVGDGTKTNLKTYPVRIGDENDWIDVSTGEHHTVAIKNDGSIWNWGLNTWNLLVNSDTLVECSPIIIKDFSDGFKGSCYGEQSLIITGDSLLYAWGNNGDGRLGIANAKQYYNQPKKIEAFTGMKNIYSKYSQNLFVNNSNQCFVFGNNWPGGYVGLPTNQQPIKPTLLNEEIVAKNVYLSYNHNYIQTQTGKWYVWGVNHYGCFGNGSSSNVLQATPVEISLDNAFKRLALGYYHTTAIKGKGTLWAWGSNSDGQLGDSTTNTSYTPIQITDDEDWRMTACGLDHTIALKENGTLWAWGSNSDGQLGDSTTTDRHYPVQIGFDTNWDSVACGRGHTIARKEDGTLWAWGDNRHGQLGDSSTSDISYPTQIGDSSAWKTFACGDWHTIALKEDGTLWAWGYNRYGQLGDSTTTDRHYPVQIGNKIDWIKIVASNACSYAICSPSGFIAPSLVLPIDKTIISDSDTFFVWESITDASSYQFQIASDSLFTNISYESVSDTTRKFPEIAISGIYYWRVRAVNESDTTSWSPIWIYTIDDTSSKLLSTKQYLHGLWNGTSHEPTAILCELRTGADLMSSTLSDCLPAIIDSTGEAKFDFGDLSDSDYWLVVRAPGYLPLGSTSKISLSESGSSYDFTIGYAQAAGGNKALYYDGTDYLMRGGDYNTDRRSSASDIAQLSTSFGNNVKSYVPETENTIYEQNNDGKQIEVKLYMHGAWDGTEHPAIPLACEIRTGTDLQTSSLEKRVAGFINDAGTATFDFGDAADGDYWIVVRAAGYLPLGSTSKVTLSNTKASYDFTTGNAAVAGGNRALHYDGTYYMMRGGDYNADRRSSASDIAPLSTSFGKSLKSYVPEP